MSFERQSKFKTPGRKIEKQKQSQELCFVEEALTKAIGATHGCAIAESCWDRVRQGAHRHLGESTQIGERDFFALAVPHD